MQNSVISVKKDLKMNMLKKKKCLKVRDHRHYTGEYRGVRIAYAISSLVHLKSFL